MREDTSEVIIDDEEQYDRVKKFTMAFLPRFAERVKKYEGRRPVFDHHHIEPALRLAVSRRSPRSTSTPARSRTPARATSRTRSPRTTSRPVKRSRAS
jgi:Ribonuclease G/E